jgi:hypothetical protein
LQCDTGFILVGLPERFAIGSPACPIRAFPLFVVARGEIGFFFVE